MKQFFLEIKQVKNAILKLNCCAQKLNFILSRIPCLAVVVLPSHSPVLIETATNSSNFNKKN